jgi:DNA-binding protein H-NS
MEQVVASIHRVTGIMAGITSASQEQTSGIEQVNEAIGQMDQVTQQNAALVEEAAAAASSMQDQAAQLAEAVDVFKLDRHAGSGARSAPARAVLKAAPRPARAAVAATPGRTARAVELASDWEAF